MAARIGIGPCRYIIKQLWATVPDTQVQSFGIILLYNMSVRLYNHDDFDFIKRMIFSGLDLNRPQHWKSRRRLHDTYPRSFDLTFWQAFLRWSPRLYDQFHSNDPRNIAAVHRLRTLALLLDIAPPDQDIRLPAGRETLLSATSPITGLSPKI